MALFMTKLVIFVTSISLCLCSKRLELLSESGAKFCLRALKAGAGLFELLR